MAEDAGESLSQDSQSSSWKWAENSCCTRSTSLPRSWNKIWMWEEHGEGRETREGAPQRPQDARPFKRPFKRRCYKRLPECDATALSEEISKVWLQPKTVWQRQGCSQSLRKVTSSWFQHNFCVLSPKVSNRVKTPEWYLLGSQTVRALVAEAHCGTGDRRTLSSDLQELEFWKDPDVKETASTLPPSKKNEGEATKELKRSARLAKRLEEAKATTWNFQGTAAQWHSSPTRSQVLRWVRWIELVSPRQWPGRFKSMGGFGLPFENHKFGPNPWTGMPLQCANEYSQYRYGDSLQHCMAVSFLCSEKWWLYDFTGAAEGARDREDLYKTKKWTSKPSVAVVLPTHLKSPFVSIKSLKDV